MPLRTLTLFSNGVVFNDWTVGGPLSLGNPTSAININDDDSDYIQGQLPDVSRHQYQNLSLHPDWKPGSLIHTVRLKAVCKNGSGSTGQFRLEQMIDRVSVESVTFSCTGLYNDFIFEKNATPGGTPWQVADVDNLVCAILAVNDRPTRCTYLVLEVDIEYPPVVVQPSPASLAADSFNPETVLGSVAVSGLTASSKASGGSPNVVLGTIQIVGKIASIVTRAVRQLLRGTVRVYDRPTTFTVVDRSVIFEVQDRSTVWSIGMSHRLNARAGDENVIYAFDFGKRHEIINGDTIQSATVEVVEEDPDAPEVGSVSVSGNLVEFPLSFSGAGDFTIKCTVVLTGGSTLVETGLVRVVV